MGNAGTEDFIRFGLGSTCAWNSSVLVTWTAGSGNDSCWTSDLEVAADELLRERLFGTVPGQRDDARARMSTEDAPAGTGESAGEEDLRTLWIDRDDQGQRFKEWKKVCSESSEERQADSPVAGPPSCLTVCKQMQHHGGNPKLWMHLWMKELGVSGKDRLYHEVTTLVEILYQGGTYDQLNVGAVASLEISSRRLIAIVEATSKGLGNCSALHRNVNGLRPRSP